MHAAATPAEAPQGRSNEPNVEAPPTPPPSTHSGGPKSASPRQTRSTPSRSSSTPSASGSPSSSSRSTPIEPAYFYLGGSGGGSNGSGSGSVDDVDAVPVFEPSMDDFRDFYSFCERIDHWGMRSGIVKVVPPAEWTGKLPKLDEGEVKRLRAVRIKNSISQMFSKAGGGAFHQKNIVHPAKVVNAKQWADLCASKEQRGPDMERMKGNARAEAKARKQELRMGHFAVPTDDNDDDDDDDGEQNEEDGVRTRSGGSGFKASAQAQAQAQAQSRAQAQPPAPSRETAKHGQKAEGKVKMADRTTEAEWDAFDYENGWCHEAGPKATADDWKDEEVCRAIEKEYWSGLIWGKPPMYGADLEGTLFTDETKDWNVGHLDNVLTRLKLKHRLKGVTTPYLYFGMWRATFAWHVEDVDLYSINYIHFGAPKQWYSIRQSDRQRFELAMAGAFPGDSSRCRHFMRHKSYLASPSFLASNNIKPLRLVQHAGEFVITYPYGYHSGYNLGFNCAESLNFALESWIPIGRRAGHCLCDPDAVHMDIDALLEESAELEEMERRREERQRGQVEHEARLEVRRQRERERRRQRKLEMEQLGQGHKQQQQQRAALASGEEEKERQDNCVFCPYNLDDDLVPLRADAKARHAHRFCTNFMPECWVGEDDDDRGAGEVVMGFDSINKARWSLKCQLCATPQLAKKGAKVQCTYSKCSRTTHAACALKDTSGWLLDVVGDRAADRLEGKTTGTDEIEEDDEEPTRMVVLCKQHNPEQKQREAVRKALVLKACVMRLKEGQNVRVRTSRGVWMTVLVEVKMAPQGHDGSGEGTIVTSDGAETPWSRVVFEQKALKEAEAEVERLMKEEEEAKVKLEAEKEREEWHRKSRKEAEEVDKQIAIEQERVQAMKHEHNREAQESQASQMLPDETAGAHIDSQMEDEHKKRQPKKRKGPPVQGPWTENGEAPQLIRKPYQKRKKVEASADQPQGLLPASRNVMAVDHMLAGTSASVANAPQLPPPRPISAPEHNAGPMTMVQPGGTAWGPRVLSWHPPSYDLYYQQRRYAEQQRGLALQQPYQPSIQHPSHPQHPPHPQHVHYQPHPKYQTPHLSQQRPLYHHERLPPREQHPQGSTFHQVSAPPRTSMSGPSDMYQEQYPTLPSPAHHNMGDQRQSMTPHHRYSNLAPGAMMADDATGEVAHSPSQRSGHHPEITRDRFSHETFDRATSVHPSYPRQYS